MIYMSKSKTTIKYHYYVVFTDCFNSKHKIRFSSAFLYSVQEVFELVLEKVDLYYIYQVDPGIIRSFFYKFSEYE